jgi:hypothetical protein
MAIVDMKIKDVPSIMNQITFMQVKLKCMSCFHFIFHIQGGPKGHSVETSILVLAAVLFGLLLVRDPGIGNSASGLQLQ